MNKGTKKGGSKKAVETLPIINPDAAGIDISAKMHMVAVPVDRDPESIRQFGCYTRDLEKLADWLEDCEIKTVAMESTGVYWKPLFTLLIERGFDVALVNARQIKNVSGQKTDKQDARWLQRLHSCGLLNSSFLPDDATERLRTLTRHRRCLQQDSSRYVLRMQKALELMNIKIHLAISDIMGKTGKLIIHAIIAGERNAVNFLQFVDPRIKATKEELVESLTGTWNEQQLFLLKENYELYETMLARIDAVDQKIQEQLAQQAAMQQDGVIEPYEPAPVKRRKKKSKNQPYFDLVPYLKKIHGVDVTRIYGISATSALEILSETGRDLSKWENEKKFTSWLNLCPNNKITGGKVVSSMVMKKKSGMCTQAFRSAANSLNKSNHYLGQYFRKMKSKGGNKYAIIATARKLATIYYLMVRNKKEFNPIEINDYQQKQKEKKIKYLQLQLAKLQATG
jgi:transposase